MHKEILNTLSVLALLLPLQGGATAAGDHAHHHEHHQMMQSVGYHRSVHDYPVPAITLIDADGRPVELAALLGDEGPVMLNFIYTSCTSICPVMSATFAKVRDHLGPELTGVRMVSISIDPEYDTPERLRDYADRFSADDGWLLLTGSREDVVRVQRGFDIYRGPKTSHIPATFLRVAGDARWVRLEGLTTAAELIHEYRRLTAN